MTKQQLQYFLSAVEFSNLSKAANFHYISIPTFTRHINDLEEELGTKLFKRNNRGLKLTAAGALFHSVARDTLLELYQYYVQILDKGYLIDKPRDEFIMGYYAFGGMFSEYSNLIGRYLDIWLKRPCVLYCIPSGDMTEMVRNGMIDVGAVSSAKLKKCGDEFESRKFYSWECQLYVDNDHELASRDSISVEEIIANYASFSHYLPKDMVSEEIRSQKIKSASDIMKICQLFFDILPLWSSLREEDDTFQPENDLYLLSSMMQRPELNGKHAIRIEGANLSMDVRLFWRRGNSNPAIQKFIDALNFAGIE